MMSVTGKSYLVLLLFVCIFACLGDEILPFIPVSSLEQRILVPTGEKESSSGFYELPAMKPAPDMTAVLKVNVRMLADSPSGWHPWMCMELNGHEIGPLNAANMQRLLLRENEMKTTHPQEPSAPFWRVFKGHHVFMTLFGPADTNIIDSRILDTSNPYTFYFNVDDFASKVVVGADGRIENDVPNKLRFINALPLSEANCILQVKDVQLGYVKTSLLSKYMKSSVIAFDKDWKKAATVSGNDSVLNVSEYGGMQIEVKGELFYVQSAFSYADTPIMGYNHLTVNAPDNADGVSIQVNQVDENEVTVEMKAQNITLKRRIVDNGHFFRVQDTISNVTDEDIGIKWQNSLSLDGAMPQNWRIAGLTKSNGTDSNSADAMTNPTVFMEATGASVGMVVEDSVSRILLEMFKSQNSFVIGSKAVGIPQNKSIQVEWSIYPLQSPENGYFDMINAIRQDWNVNVTVPGPYLFRAQPLPGMKLGFSTMEPWFEYATGLKYNREQFKDYVNGEILKLREKFPNVKLLALFETNLVFFDASTVPWGKELPCPLGEGRQNVQRRYGQYLSSDLSNKINAVSELKDSLLHDKNGNVMIDNVYVYKDNIINLMPQPEMGNARYRQMLEQIEFLMKNIDYDGIYLDQFNPTLRDGISYDKWDGYSVALDKTGRIVSKFYNYAITGAVGRMEIVKRIKELGGEVLTNGHPVTKEEQGSGRLSFAEMENDQLNVIEYLNKKPPETRYTAMGHLASPIALNLCPSLHTKDAALKTRVITKGLIYSLRNGLLPYYYETDVPLEGPDACGFEVCNWMFPFTPVKLGEGVLVGKERTVVCKSGTYAVGGNQKPVVAHFNNKSQRVEDTKAFVISGEPGKWIVKVVLDDWNEIAAIEVRN